MVFGFRFGFAFKNNPFILWPVALAVDLWPVGSGSFGLRCHGFMPVPLLLGWLGWLGKSLVFSLLVLGFIGFMVLVCFQVGEAWQSLGVMIWAKIVSALFWLHCSLFWGGCLAIALYRVLFEIWGGFYVYGFYLSLIFTAYHAIFPLITIRLSGVYW